MGSHPLGTLYSSLENQHKLEFVHFYFWHGQCLQSISGIVPPRWILPTRVCYLLPQFVGGVWVESGVRPTWLGAFLALLLIDEMQLLSLNLASPCMSRQTHLYTPLKTQGICFLPLVSKANSYRLGEVPRQSLSLILWAHL